MPSAHDEASQRKGNNAASNTKQQVPGWAEELVAYVWHLVLQQRTTPHQRDGRVAAKERTVQVGFIASAHAQDGSAHERSGLSLRHIASPQTRLHSTTIGCKLQ